jgi:hypothetical protein
LVHESRTFRITVQPQVRVFPSCNSARTEEREGRCLRSPCRLRPCSGDRQLGFWGASTRLSKNNFFFLATSDMTRETGQGSGSSERMTGYDQYSSLLFYVLQIIYVVHLYCFVCSHRFIQTVLSYHIMIFLMSVHTIIISYLSVLILQLCCLYWYLFIFNCSVSLYAYCIYMIHMLYILLIHIDMDQFEITISMINYLLYVIIIILIYGIKMIRKMCIILTKSARQYASVFLVRTNPPKRERCRHIHTHSHLHFSKAGPIQYQRRLEQEPSAKRFDTAAESRRG